MKILRLLLSLMLIPGLLFADASSSEITTDGGADVQVKKRSVYFQEKSGNPSNPPTNGLKVFSKDDGGGTTKLYMIDSAGTVTEIGAAGAGVGDIESVTAGDGLTGGGTSGAVTLNVVGGVGITANANDIAFDGTEIDAITWSDGVNASNIWTFDVSGTDHTMTAGDGRISFSNNVTILGTATIDDINGEAASALNVTPDSGQNIVFNLAGAGRFQLAYGGLTFTIDPTELATSSKNLKLPNQSGILLATSGAITAGAVPFGDSTAGINRLDEEPTVLSYDRSTNIFSSGGIALNNGATSSGFLDIYEDTDNGTNKIRILAPALGADVTYTLPINDGDAGQQLQTDGSGGLSWEAAGSGSGDSITVNSSAATDPDFADGDIDWTLTGGNSITATVACAGCIDATDMAADSVGESELIEAMNFTATGDWDFGGGTLQIPNSTTLPGTCEVGDSYMDTDATTGQRFYLCESANTWALQGDGGAGGGDSVSVDGVAVTDPNFASTGDVDFVDTANTITANINANSVALTTDTTGNYAAGDAEAGAALTGDSATSFFSSGTIEGARLGTFSKSFTITAVTSAGDFGAIWKTPAAITITRVNVVQVGATNVVGHLDECDSNGANCTAVDSGDITADGLNDADDGALSNASIDANDWIGWHTTSVSGTNTRITVTFDYTVN
jgi:hypothetical protein